MKRDGRRKENKNVSQKRESIACRKEREIKWEKNIQYEGREWTRERRERNKVRKEYTVWRKRMNERKEALERLV